MAAFTESYSVMPGGVPRYRQRGTGSDFDVQGVGTDILLGSAPLAAGGGASGGMNFTLPSWAGDAKRKAADVFERPLRSMGLVRETDPSRLRLGRVLPGAAALSAVSALGNLADSNDPLGRNVMEAVGETAGGIGLSGLAALIPAPPPVKLALMALASVAGGQGGKGLGGGLYDMGNSPESRAAKQLSDQARAAVDAEAYRMQTLMPIQNQAAQIALQNEKQRQAMLDESESQRMVQRALAEGLLAQQAYGAQQQSAIVNAMLGVG